MLAARLTWNRVRILGARYILSHDDSKAGLQMEVDVTVQEPWSGVVRLCQWSRDVFIAKSDYITYPEADGHIVTCGRGTRAHHIAPDWVVVVVL